MNEKFEEKIRVRPRRKGNPLIDERRILINRVSEGFDRRARLSIFFNAGFFTFNRSRPINTAINL